MKARNIKSVLRRKFDDWVASIDDTVVQKAAKEDCIITGGSIASMLLGEKVNDYDVYFRTVETAASVARHYVRKFKADPPTKFKGSNKLVNVNVIVRDGRVMVVVQSAGIAGEDSSEEYQYFEQVADDTDAQRFVEDTVVTATEVAEGEQDKDKPKYRPVFLTSNAITLSHKVQLVIRFYGSVDDIHKNYDFLHCTCSWDAKTGELRLPPKALESLLAKQLQYQHSLYPLCAIIRTRKFLARGWNIDAGQYVKMAWDLNSLDLSDMAVLEDQMVGVDAAYFYEVLQLLREHDKKKVDGTYLMQVIDRVFG